MGGIPIQIDYRLIVNALAPIVLFVSIGSSLKYEFRIRQLSVIKQRAISSYPPPKAMDELFK